MNAQQTIALITGAGRPRGIGFEVARQLARGSIKVILTARDVGAARVRAGELRVEGLDVVGVAVDIASPASVAALVESVQTETGRLDILINNAAATSAYGELAATADLDESRRVFEATLFGNWRMSQAFLPMLRQSAHPRLVNVSSGAGSHGDIVFGLTSGNSMGTSYAVSKAALNALTVRLAQEEKSPRVLVNAVCPGFTATFEGAEQMGARPVADGAASVVWAALLPDEGPSGGLFRDGKPMPW